MKNEKYNWLPHLENSVHPSARGYTTSGYAMALEGWRRGLELTFLKGNHKRRKSELKYQLNDGKQKHVFVVSRGDLTTEEAVEICKNKHITKKYLSQAGVLTPQGEVFGPEIENLHIIKYADEITYPVVLKPSDGTGGRGVVANIKNKKELKKALNFTRGELNLQEVILEKHYSGIDHRIYVVDNKVCGAFRRYPANVIGDGQRTIEELLSLKQQQRDKNPALQKRPIVIDNESKLTLEKQNLKMDSIPAKNQRVFLKSKSNISTGGDSVDVSKELPEEIKKLAIDAVASIPGLPNAGVDILYDESKKVGVVIEINTQASLNSHLFPMEGDSYDVPKAILDYYFPETKRIPGTDNLNFDYNKVFKHVKESAENEYRLPKLVRGTYIKKRLVLIGDVKRTGIAAEIKDIMVSLNLYGSITPLKFDRLSLVIAGLVEDVEELLGKLKSESFLKEYRILKIEEKYRITAVNADITVKNRRFDEPMKEGINYIRLKDSFYIGKSKKTVDKTKSKSKSKSKSLARAENKSLLRRVFLKLAKKN